MEAAHPTSYQTERPPEAGRASIVLRLLLRSLLHLMSCVVIRGVEPEVVAERGKQMETRARKTIVLWAAFVLLGGILAVPATQAGTTTKVNPDASTISSQVHHELLMLPWYGVFDYLEYQVNGTEVTLSGQVTSIHSTTREDAANFVRRIPGVTKVVNNIEVLPPSPFDDQIRRAEYRTIFSQGDLGRYTLGAIPQVHIVVKNGHVSLEGLVVNQMDKNMAGIVANSVPNVFSVENPLQIG